MTVAVTHIQCQVMLLMLMKVITVTLSTIM